MFGGGAPAEEVDDNGVIFPSSPDELEEMAAAWEEDGWVPRA